jgi:hypothetical protein
VDVVVVPKPLEATYKVKTTFGIILILQLGTVARTCNPCYLGGRDRKTEIEARLGKNVSKTPSQISLV